MEPLPPVKEVEYRCIIGRLFEELSGMEFITFAFETAKEFSSFRYEIAVRYRIQPNALEFKVLGMTATRTMMPAHGTARSVLKIPLLPVGIYTAKMIKSDGTENMFVIEVTKRGLQIDQPIPRKRFIDLVIDKSAASPLAKITSTVSRTPPAPLIPRTIQKRQPPPLTPEEQALLASLKSETPEERDAREELELFGGKKKVDKKELAEAEKDMGAEGKADTKSAPKHDAKHESKQHESKHEHKQDKPVKVEAKPVKQEAKKAEPAKAKAPVKAPVKPTVKPKATTKTGKTKTASTTVTKHAAKSKTVAKPAAKKTAGKVKTGSAKTSKHNAGKKAKKK